MCLIAALRCSYFAFICFIKMMRRKGLRLSTCFIPLFIINSSHLCSVICTFILTFLYVLLITFFNLYGTSILSNVLHISLLSPLSSVAFKFTKSMNSSSHFSIFLFIIILSMNILSFVPLIIHLQILILQVLSSPPLLSFCLF